MNERDENAVKEAIKQVDEAEFKRLVKQAISEKLDEYVLKFGKWSVFTLSVLILGGLVRLAILMKD